MTDLIKTFLFASSLFVARLFNCSLFKINCVDYLFVKVLGSFVPLFAFEGFWLGGEIKATALALINSNFL